jgi:hypothetical protein
VSDCCADPDPKTQIDAEILLDNKGRSRFARISLTFINLNHELKKIHGMEVTVANVIITAPTSSLRPQRRSQGQRGAGPGGGQLKMT